MNGEAFEAYVEQVLVPKLNRGTVVILDNLATHRNATAAKAHLRRIEARTFTDMFQAHTEICELSSPDEC